MSDMDFRRDNVVQGFSFFTEKDALLAVQEQKKIEYLESRVNYHNPASILNIYQKAIKEHIFKTPLGLQYLRHLQEYLQERPEIDNESIPPIPLYKNYDGEFREKTSPARNRVVPAKKKKSIALPMSIMLNVVLVIAVIAMFAITLTSDQPNVLNYERVIINRYASWEQELTEREQAVREKERELKMELPLNE